MSKKLVDYSRNYGEVKVRYGGKYQPTSLKNENNFEVIAPEQTGELVERFGIYGVDSLSAPNEVFADFSVSLLSADNVPNDENKEDAKYNQSHATIAELSDGKYVITTDNLKAYTSTDSAQGTHKWLGIAIATGEDSIIGLTFNGHTCTQDDVDDATSVHLSAGSMIYWFKAELGNTNIVLGNDDKIMSLEIMVE